MGSKNELKLNLKTRWSMSMWIFWKVFIGNDDSEVEGVWENWFTDEVSQAKKQIRWVKLKTDQVSQTKANKKN